MIRKNLYYLTDASLAFAAITGALGLYGIIHPRYFVYSLVTASLSAGAQITIGCAAVENNSRRFIYVKPEDGTKPFALNPGYTYYGADGFKVNGRVYKRRDGVHATVNDDDTVTVHSLTGKLINAMGGGYKERHSLTDDWQPLFDA